MVNRAAFMTGLNKLEIRDVPMPQIKERQVLVALEYVGICGSDVHYLQNGRIGDFVVNGDFILGHEAAGTVAATGEGVGHLKVGDKVALEPGITCGQCEFCKTGRYNLCPNVEFLATPPYNGCFKNYISYPENMCFKLPDNITTREGALVEPLSVGMHAARQGGVTLGSSVIILGAGCIGLTALLASKAFGATDITIADVIPKRLDKAVELGATRAINSMEADVIKEMDGITGGAGADVVIEAAGSVITSRQTPYLVKRGGTVVLVGMTPQDKFEYDFSKLLSKEAQIKTVFRYRNIYPQAIKAIAGGSINVSGIVTHEYVFDDIQKAFDVNINQKKDVVKVVIKMC